jgi:chromosome segregation ATPase
LEREYDEKTTDAIQKAGREAATERAVVEQRALVAEAASVEASQTARRRTEEASRLREELERAQETVAGLRGRQVGHEEEAAMLQSALKKAQTEIDAAELRTQRTKAEGEAEGRTLREALRSARREMEELEAEVSRRVSAARVEGREAATEEVRREWEERAGGALKEVDALTAELKSAQVRLSFARRNPSLVVYND